MKRRLSAMRCAKLCAVLVAAVLGLRPIDVEAQQGLTAEQLYGCWRRESLQTIGRTDKKAYVDFCFRTDGTVYESYVAPEGLGGEDLFKWTLLNDHDLVINRQTCGAELGDERNQRFLFLNTCVYMGTWMQLCPLKLMYDTGDGCAKQD